ncbi:MAG: nucleotide exchange factor GrpE [Actinomycetales bacterium]|nr:nucleotide exchange factor GrpE [Actinomycetales bacterium]
MTENELQTDSVENSVDVAAEVEEESFDLTATLTADLQRLQAEYSNYRKRVERDRAVASEIAVASVLSELLSTLDDIDRAAQHGELTGGFKSVADQLISTTTKLGLEKYGTDGDEFDPQIHEALMHDTSADVKVATASKILQPGYKFKERVLRPARVSVTDPE